jgi:hypothetical protein
MYVHTRHLVAVGLSVHFLVSLAQVGRCCRKGFLFFFVYCYFAMYTWYYYLTVRLKHLRFQGVLSSHVTLYYLTFFLLLGFQYGWHGWRVCFFFLVLILFCVTVLKG